MTVTAAAEIVPAGTWTIDPSHSSLEFGVRHLGLTTVRGRAAGFTGTIVGGEQAAVEGNVAADRITTFEENRDGHLQSPEFFDTSRYPELLFASTSVERRGDDVVVRGDLTIKGVTRPVVLTGGVDGPSVDPWGKERIGLALNGVIDRTEFGLRWNTPLPGGGFLLADEVSLAASFSAVAEA